MDGLWGTGWFWFGAFVVALLVNGRAAFKLFVDWKGMLTTCRFVEDAYAGLDTLPDETALERAPAAPVFLHLVPAWEEPAGGGTRAARGGAGGARGAGRAAGGARGRRGWGGRGGGGGPPRGGSAGGGAPPPGPPRGARPGGPPPGGGGGGGPPPIRA